MSLLITGASGAIGSHLYRRFAEAGWPVRGIDIEPADKVEVLDVTDRATFADYVGGNGIERVIHCAGRMDVHGVSDPLELVSANVLGLTNLCSIMRWRPGAQVIFMSSRGVYPWLHASERPTPLAEDGPTEVDVVRSVYDMTKYCIEMVAERYARQYGLRVTGLRLASTFGLGKTAEKHGHQSILVELFHVARAREPLHVAGADQQTDFLYYGDVWQACLRLLATQGALPHRMNVSGGVRPLRHFIEALERVFPQARLSVGDGLDYLGTGGFGYVNLDPALAWRMTGYRAAYAPEEAFAEMERLLSGRPAPFALDFGQLCEAARTSPTDGGSALARKLASW